MLHNNAQKRHGNWCVSSSIPPPRILLPSPPSTCVTTYKFSATFLITLTNPTTLLFSSPSPCLTILLLLSYVLQFSSMAASPRPTNFPGVGASKAVKLGNSTVSTLPNPAISRISELKTPFAGLRRRVVSLNYGSPTVRSSSVPE